MVPFARLYAAYQRAKLTFNFFLLAAAWIDPGRSALQPAEQWCKIRDFVSTVGKMSYWTNLLSTHAVFRLPCFSFYTVPKLTYFFFRCSRSSLRHCRSKQFKLLKKRKRKRQRPRKENFIVSPRSFFGVFHLF